MTASGCHGYPAAATPAGGGGAAVESGSFVRCTWLVVGDDC